MFDIKIREDLAIQAFSRLVFVERSHIAMMIIIINGWKTKIIKNIDEVLACVGPENVVVFQVELERSDNVVVAVKRDCNLFGSYVAR
jgi:hypothetical protein